MTALGHQPATPDLNHQPATPGLDHRSATPGLGHRSAMPAEVRFARWTSWLALAGALIQMTAVLGLIIADEMHHGGRPGEVLPLAAVLAVGLSPLVLTAWAAIRSVAGRAGGRAVLWSLGPLILACSLALSAAVFMGIFHGREVRQPEGVLAAVSIAGTALFYAGLTPSGTVWLLPDARAYLAGRRRADRAGRGRRTMTAAAILLGLAAVSTLAVTVAAAVNPRQVATWGDAERITTALTGATVLAGATAVVQIVLLGAVVIGRVAGRPGVRAAAYVAGFVTTVPLIPAAVGFAKLITTVAEETGGDTGVVFMTATITGYVLAVLLHLVAVLLLAMPSVSTWLAGRPASR
ncbi:hypothetical protein [Actinoplanes sp. G11-F43]|uniref:hypothetical protein n=1 Tax=Actinoplanes sp. G11-F43 TaxID=3424130 RepID=UPI003D352463